MLAAGDRDTPEPKKRAAGKRGARACVNCRKLKKTCDNDPEANGLSAACARCQSHGIECVYDRPASSVIDDAGLNRLSAIEACQNTQERRLDTLVSSVGEIQTQLSDILAQLRNGPHVYSNSHNLPAPRPPILPPTLPSAYSLKGNSSQTGHTPPNLPSFAHFNSQGTYTQRKGSDTSSPNSSTPVSSGLAVLATLASTEPPRPDVDRFASRLHAPIQALADAADQLEAREEKAEDLNENEASDANLNQFSENSRPKKKIKRETIPTVAQSLTTQEFDVVAKGLVSDRDARALVLLWMKELQPFCALLDPERDTYNSLRQNRFLFDVVVHTALRAQGRNSPPSPQLIAVAEQTRNSAKELIFLSMPVVEVVQALIIMACFSQEPYLLSGFALRLALSARLDKTWQELENHGWDKTDEKAKKLTVHLRTWLYVCFLEFKHTRATGKMILLRQREVDFFDRNAERLLDLPFAIFTDLRTVANLRLTFIERKIIEASEDLGQQDSTDLTAHLAYIYRIRGELKEWHERYDAMLASRGVFPMSWARKSHLRHFQEASFFSPINVLGPHLFSTKNKEVIEIAYQALQSARETIRTVLSSPAYASSIQFSGYLMKVDLVFCSLLAIKLASTLPDFSDQDELGRELTELLNVLNNCAGSQKHSTTLRFAIQQYMSRPDAAETATNTSQYTANTSLPASHKQNSAQNYFTAETNETKPDFNQFSQFSSLTSQGAAGAQQFMNGLIPTTPNDKKSNAPAALGAGALVGESDVDWSNLSLSEFFNVNSGDDFMNLNPSDWSTIPDPGWPFLATS